MAIRPKDVYRGKHRYRMLITVLACILLAILAGAVALFYALQNYIVYGQDGVSLEVPFLSTAAPVQETEKPSGVILDKPVEVVITTPNFEDVDTAAGEELSALKAVYIPWDEIDAEGIEAAAQKAQELEANGLVLQLKPESGLLPYLSTVTITDAYGVNGAWDIRETVTALKEEQGLWLAAELSVCVDEAMATRNSPIALKDTLGNVYSDSKGIWLDPYSRSMREYIISLMTELSDMGFDEIILSNIAHPEDFDKVVYSQSMTQVFDVNTCVSNLAMKLAEAMEAYEIKVSALYGELGGQDVTFFPKVFDRICRYTTPENLSDYRTTAVSAMTKGSRDFRFVPIMESAPETASWIVR